MQAGEKLRPNHLGAAHGGRGPGYPGEPQRLTGYTQRWPANGSLFAKLQPN
jgi:hypothetical protein